MTSTTLTIRISEDEKAKLARLSRHTNRSKSFLAAHALADYLERELAIVEGIEHGLADARAGRIVPHDEAMRELRAAIVAKK